MRVLTVSGWLVSDAEIKTNPTTKNEFVAFRMVNHEYDKNAKNNEKEDTFWLDVIANTNIRNMVPHLKKGKLVNVIGRYKDGTWTRADNTTEIQRTILADSIFFVEGGKKQEEGSASNVSSTQAVPQTTGNVAPPIEDDLPF